MLYKFGSIKASLSLVSCIFFLLLSFFVIPHSVAQTIQTQTPIPGGTIYVDTTWSAANSPYTVLGTVSVANGVTLTIEPGVELYWNDSGRYLSLFNGATLVAEGTEANPILFSRNGTGHWGGIYVANGGEATLSHCEIAYGGSSSSDGGLHTASSLVNMSDCRIHHSGHHGLNLAGAGLSPSFTRVQIENSGSNAVWQNTVDMNPAYNNLSLSGNGQDAIVSLGGTVNRHITLSPPGLVGEQSIPYRFIGSSSVAIANNQALTVTPGVELRFNSGQYLVVYNGGTLVAEGTEANPILFSRNGTGHWGGIYVANGGEATLSHCEIAYGGSSSSDGGLHTASSLVNMSDCRIHHSGHHGLNLTGAGLSPSFTRVQIENSGSNAVSQNTVDMNPAYNNLSLSGNGQDAIVSPGGTVSRHITLSSPGLVGEQIIPYRFIGSSSVAIANRLTVTPGVELRFNSGQYLVVYNGGRLDAVGTAEKPVIFTSVLTETIPAGSWGGIYVANGGQATLSHCEIAYGGSSSSDGGLHTASSLVNMSDCRIHHSGHHGLNLAGAGLSPSFTRVQIENSGSNAVSQNTVDMNPAYNNLSLSGNGQDAIVSPGGTVSRHITLSPPGLVGEQIIPYRFIGSSVTIANSQALTVTPGVELRFNSGQYLVVYNGGTLVAEGTEANPILFSRNGTGHWGGIYIANGGEATLSHCEIAYGGSSSSDGGLYTASSNVSVFHCRIRQSAGDGVRIVSNAQPYLRCNQITDNAFGLRNETPATPIDARFNWWGSNSGPYHPTINPGGEDNGVSDGVLFVPWSPICVEDTQSLFLYLPVIIR